jgi:hypothetical protein
MTSASHERLLRQLSRMTAALVKKTFCVLELAKHTLLLLYSGILEHSMVNLHQQGGREVRVPPPLFLTLWRLWLNALYGHVPDGLRVQNIGMETFIAIAQLNSALCSGRCLRR